MLGLIARADARGLGIQTKAFHDAMRPAKTMVIDCPSQKPLPIRRDWYPDATWIHGLPTVKDFAAWLPGLDVVYTAETGYGHALWDEAERLGVRTVLHANYEFLNRNDRPSVWAAPSTWHLDDFPAGTVHLPVPITPAPTDFPQAGTARHFLHVVGRPAIHDRNGSADLLQSLQHVRSDITITITCQERGYLDGLNRGHIPGNVTLKVRTGDAATTTDLYRGQHVLVMPRRFGGLCLPAQEATAAGMPVIMPNISPNDAWLPAEWLVPATKTGSFRARQHIELHTVDHHALAARIDQFATDPNLYTEASAKAQEIAAALSWDALTPRYMEVLAG